MITYAALAPHPPLLIPYIGGSRLGEVKQTVNGMRMLAGELAASKPDTIVFITPHGNVFADGISALGDAELQGDFSDFGVSSEISRHKNDLELLKHIGMLSAEKNLNFIAINGETARKNRLKGNLDHGILVPLYYLSEAGLDIPILAVSFGFIREEQLYDFGRIIREAAEKIGRRIAVLASGDMSHHLMDEGPYRYHPDGPRFDRIIKELLSSGQVEEILKIEPKLRENAGECGYRSILIMLGTLDGQEFSARVFSYQGPFGVGYLTAGLTPGNARESRWEKIIEARQGKLKKIRQNESAPVRWARLVLENYVTSRKIPDLPEDMQGLKGERAGLFVSLKKNGELRGCIGTIEAAYGDLAEEIAANAISAGSRDYRFLPVEKAELDDLVYSVDILGKPQPCMEKDLDPRKYGVIVSKGSKRGLLLPDLEGVDSVEQQVSIALQKAGISRGEGYTVERFEVKRYA